MSATCGTVIGGPVTLSVSGTVQAESEFDSTTSSRTISNIKFETEGSVNMSPKTFTFEDRGEGRGHTKTRRNSYVEGTITLASNFGRTEQDNVSGQTEIDQITLSDVNDMFCLCGATVQMIADCGDIYTMTNAVFTGEGSIDLREGTATFRFSSPFPIRKGQEETNFNPDGTT